MIPLSEVLQFKILVYFLPCKEQCQHQWVIGKTAKGEEKSILIGEEGREREERAARYKRMIVKKEKEGKVETEAKRKRRGRNVSIYKEKETGNRLKVFNPFFPISPSDQNM